MRDASTSPLCIGIDDGYAFTKIALPSGRVLAVPSRARLGVAGVTALQATHQTVQEYVADGLRYSAGAVDGESTRFDEYPVSCLNRVIVQHALQEASLSGRVLHAVSGLPVSAFYHPEGTKRNAFISRKIANLLTAARPADDRLPVP